MLMVRDHAYPRVQKTIAFMNANLTVSLLEATREIQFSAEEATTPKLQILIRRLLDAASTVCDAGAMQLTTDDIAIKDMVDE